MKKTYHLRRQDILERPVLLMSLLEKYPPLKDPDEVRIQAVCICTIILYSIYAAYTGI